MTAPMSKGQLWSDPQGNEWLISTDLSSGELILWRPVAGADLSEWRLAEVAE